MANKNYNYITHIDSPNRTPQASVLAVFGRPRTIDGFTYHWWGDPAGRPTFDGVVSWLSRPNGNTSAHYVVEDGRVACIVSPYDASWAGGSAIANATQIHIECNPRASEGDKRTVAQFSAQLIDAFGDKLKYGHNNWIATQCPGVYDVNQIDIDSYKWISGTDWGDVTDKAPVQPTPAPQPPEPVEVPAVQPEWIRNLKDIEDVKLTVTKAAGARRVNLLTGEEIDDVIPRGTQIDIAKETFREGKRYYISAWSAKANAAIGIIDSDLGVLVDPPKEEKPEWLKNLKDIEDKDFWTRSETPVLSLVDGKTVEVIPVNKKVRVTHSTNIAHQDLLVLEGETTCIETVYLSDTPIKNPYDDLEARVSTLEKWKEHVVQFLEGIFKNFKR